MAYLLRSMSNAVESPENILNRSLPRLDFYEKVDQQTKYKINSETVKYTETGIEQYDGATPQSRWEWLLKVLELDTFDFANGRVGHGRGKTHLLQYDDGNSVFKNSGYTTLCHREPSSMRVKATTHVDLSDSALCEFCMKQKRMLTGAKVAIDRTG